MIEKWNGVVIRSTDVGDYDRILTVLTGEKGKITVFCNGVKRIRNAAQAVGTDLFCYSEFILFRNQDKYRLRECTPIETFFDLRRDVEKLSLASYFCDLANEVCLESNDETQMQSLLLNALWCIDHKQKPDALVKAAYEFRTAAIAGFAPTLSSCCACGASDGEQATLDVMAGGILCPECAERVRDAIAAGADDGHEARILLPVDRDVLSALHYILHAPAKRLYSFSVTDDVMPVLATVCECYLTSHIGHGFKTLNFYKSLFTM